MPRDSSGNYTLPLPPVVPLDLIEADWANETLSDIMVALTDSLDRYGRGTMLAALRLDSGTPAAPSLTFGAESSMGLYRDGAGVLGISVGGAARAKFTTAGIGLQNGAVGTPSLYFLNEATSGFYRSTNQVRVACIGFEAARFWATGGPPGTVGGLRVADGSAGSPSLAFINDNDTGFFTDPATPNEFAITTAGSAAWYFGGSILSNRSPTTLPLIGTVAPVLQIAGLNALAGSSIGMSRYNAAATAANTIFMARSRGATFGTQAAVQDGDILGDLRFIGSDGANLDASSALVRAYAAENFAAAAPGPARRGGMIAFITSTIGATPDAVTRMTIDSREVFTGVGVRVVEGGVAPSGATANGNCNDIVIDSASSSGLTILTDDSASPNATVGSLNFGDKASNVVGRITYSHSTDTMGFTVGGVSLAAANATAGTMTWGAFDLVLNAGVGPTAVGSMGFRGVPQTSTSATTYDTVLADAGKHIYHPSGAGAGDSARIDVALAYPIGTSITFINHDTNNWTITLTATPANLIKADTGVTGARTLAQFGVATAIKVTATLWIISGGSSLT